jgi:3-(3-hydroxy-phenyl)propionate hydroxylase
MDRRFGSGWRLVRDAWLAAPAQVDHDVEVVALGEPGTREAEGVVAAWMQRHGCRAALVRPDHYVYGTAPDAAGLADLMAQRRAALGC